MPNDPERRIVGNVISLGSSELLARAVAFIATAYLARALGPGGFGIIGFATAIQGYLSLAVKAGIDGIGAREVARRPHEASTIAASVIVIRLSLACVALAVIAVVAWYLDKPAVVKTVIVVSGLTSFSLALDTSWVYKGLERNLRAGLLRIPAIVIADSEHCDHIFRHA